MRLSRPVILVLTVALLAAGPAPARAPVSGDDAADLARAVGRVEQRFAQWRFDEAVAEAEALYRRHPEHPAVQYLAGKAKFYQQDYAGAVALLEGAGVEAGGEGEEEDRLLRFARETLEITRDYVVVAGKHFELRVPPGLDEVLPPYALAALEQAWQRIGDDFGYHPERPIVVEAYETAEELSAATGLSVEAIKNSGTIAVCKHDKLMFTSPKALLRGYDWLDTLAHEYVHYVISRVSHNTVPIWLHEGLAKYEETRWNGEAGRALSPWAEGLLADAVQGRRPFITFEQMYPSMALLPTQQDTALAFAEVFTAIEYIVQERGGYPVIRKLIEELKAGRDDAAAVQAALGVTFDTFQRQWRTWLKRRPMRGDPAAAPEHLTFKEDAKGKVPASADDEADASTQVDNPDAQRHAHLGELLRARGRHGAAAVQYEKAYTAVGPSSPLLASKLALTYMALKNWEGAERVLSAAAQANPGFVTSHVHLGRLYMLTERHDRAEASFLRANELNPFDPEIHAGLHAIYKARGETALAEREARAYALLTSNGHAGSARRGDGEDAEAVGWLTLRSQPWARVIIGGRDTGLTTPVFRHPLPPGRHEVVLRSRTGGAEKRLEVDIERERERELDVRLDQDE